MARRKKAAKELSPEEKLQQALVPMEEQPYPIPENWCWCKIASICNFERGITFPASAKEHEAAETNIPCLRTANIQEELEIDDLLYVDISYMKKNEAKYVRADDIIMSSANSRELVGKVSYVYSTPFPMTFGGFVLAIRAKNVYSKYLFYYLRFEFLTGKFMGESTQTTNIANINTTKLGNYEFPLSPLAEQQRIVDRIESLFAKLDEAREKAQAVVDGFELRKSAILHKAFTGELTERWRKEHGVGLDSWKVIPFGNLILSGPQNGLYKPKDAYGSGTKILRIDGFYDGYVEAWETLKRLTLSATEIKLYELHLDEIVINRVNSMPYLGKSALIRKLPETCVFESNMMRISLNKECVIPEFIIRYLNSPVGLAELRKNAKQAVNQASINQKDVKSVIVKLPTLDEQEEIVRILDSLLTQEQQAKEAAEAVLDQIDTMKKAILARAFRGELGTNDPAEEWAGELVKSIL